MKKYIKIILIIIILLILTIFIHTIRNVIILVNLNNALHENLNLTNYHEQSILYNGNNIIKTEIKKKDDVVLQKILRLTDKNDYVELINKNYNGSSKTYVDTGVDKFYVSNEYESLIVLGEYYIDTESNNYYSGIWDLIKRAILFDIESVKVNDTECYKIDGINATLIVYGEEDYDDPSSISGYMCVDKNTGLIIRKVQTENSNFIIVDHKYYFNSLKDEDLMVENENEYVEQVEQDEIYN